MLKIGDKMQDFEVLDQDGRKVKSEDFIGKGRKTIVYFYPKDNTSGCTGVDILFVYDCSDALGSALLCEDLKRALLYIGEKCSRP